MSEGERVGGNKTGEGTLMWKPPWVSVILHEFQSLQYFRSVNIE